MISHNEKLLLRIAVISLLLARVNKAIIADKRIIEDENSSTNPTLLITASRSVLKIDKFASLAFSKISISPISEPKKKQTTKICKNLVRKLLIK